uniref:Uncharacterized protein n=1 Tax=Anopheles coluzzii TaxID=1518534 RepID=A0A8W7P3S4_ANOCL
MSRNEIKKSKIPKPCPTELELAREEELLDETIPPSELFHCTSSLLASESLYTATINGQECQLPFEVLPEVSSSVVNLEDTAISRQPFPCPAGGCRQPCCLFMFATHVAFDHQEVLVDTLWPGETNTVLIDPYTEPTDQPRCHRLLLLSGKIRGLGDGKHRDKLPFALMSSKCSLHGSDRLVLWITGPDAGDGHRQQYTLEAGKNESSRLVMYAVAFSGEIVPLHGSQDAAELHRSGAGLVVPEQQLDFLTDSRTKLLEVCVHFY